ncbi:family 20 glycosylhydrolase [Solihabitans fulvus]|nr:family 20 glycosylhydrolase [Solihabitans fulvus]
MTLLRTPIRLLAALAVALAGTAVAAASPAAAVNATPTTIPALQQWTGGTGAYTFGAATRIVRATGDAAALQATSQTLAEDLTALSGFTIAQVTGSTADLTPGDIYLGLGSTDTGLGAEGYQLAITDRVAVTARADAGAFAGTRTLLQLLHQGYAVPQGSARDWPAYAQRGLMVDDGRKFFTPAWLRNHIRELAYLKLNYLHLHLSDNLGFRIQSDTHPEIVSADHLSKKDVADLVALAARYHVTIVPEIDMPGHMDTILAAHQDLRLVGSDGTVNNGYIDLAKDASYTLMKDLITEYLPLFPGPYWHIGADEYVTNYGNYPQMLTYARAHYGASANAKDTYLGFVNWADGVVRAGGKTTRAWNDGLYGGSAVTVHPEVVVEFWTNSGLSPQQHVDNGHEIMNASWDPTYYVLGGAKPNVTWGYETWNPTVFQGNQTLTAAGRAKDLGAKLHVWCDNPNAETEDTVAAGIKDPLRMLAQQTWGSPKLAATYSAFQGVIASVGRNPAWPTAAQPGNLAANRPVTVSSTETPNFPGANAVDGDYGTRWSSAYADPQWLQVDLGTTRSIGRVKLTWETAYGKAYQLQTSADATNWTTIYQTSTGVGGVEDLTGLTGSGRYVRMLGTARGTTYGYSLYEFEVYAPGSTPGPVASGQTYTIGNLGSGKVVDDPASSTATGTQLIQWARHGGPNQQWKATGNPDGSFSFTNVASGLCMDVNGGSTASGAAIIQWTCHGGDNQRWLVTSGSAGVTVTGKASGLTLTVGGVADGDPLTQATDTGSGAQRWTFTQV